MTGAIISAGVISAIAFYVVFWKVGIHKVLGYEVAVDIGSTVLLMIMFAGTYTGMIAAVIGGLVLSFMLMITKRFTGCERLVRTGPITWKWEFFVK